MTGTPAPRVGQVWASTRGGDYRITILEVPDLEHMRCRRHKDGGEVTVRWYNLLHNYHCIENPPDLEEQLAAMTEAAFGGMALAKTKSGFETELYLGPTELQGRGDTLGQAIDQLYRQFQDQVKGPGSHE